MVTVVKTWSFMRVCQPGSTRQDLLGGRGALETFTGAHFRGRCMACHLFYLLTCRARCWRGGCLAEEVMALTPA